MQETLEWIKKDRLIAILRGLSPEETLTAADALRKGGVRLLEITFRQGEEPTWEETANTIRRLCETFGGTMCIGAGTVMNCQQLELAAQAGAAFILAPNVEEEVIRRTKALGLVSIPGALTPTEAALAHSAGADIVKIFPAGQLGPGYIKALMGPMGHIAYSAVGGVDETNLTAFLGAGACCVGIGGNLVSSASIRTGRLDEITAAARRYTALAAGEVR